VVGRFYVAGVFIGAPMGLYIQYFEERMGGARSFQLRGRNRRGFVDADHRRRHLFILKGKVQQHRQWMTRSFAVAIVFLEVRVVGGVTGWERLGPSAIETMVWMCVAFSLLFADLVLQWRDFSPSRVVPARVPVVQPASSRANSLPLALVKHAPWKNCSSC